MWRWSVDDMWLWLIYGHVAITGWVVMRPWLGKLSCSHDWVHGHSWVGGHEVMLGGWEHGYG